MVNFIIVNGVTIKTGSNYDPNDADSTISVCLERKGKFAATKNIEMKDTERFKFEPQISSHRFLFNETLSIVSCIGMKTDSPNSISNSTM